MEPFETNEFVPEQEPVQEAPQVPPQSVYHNSGTGRKESPYANSPYVPNFQPQQEEYQPHKPEKPTKVRKPRNGLGRKVLAAVLAIVLVAGSCCATAWFVNETWEERNEDQTEFLMHKINDLQKQIDDAAVMQGVNGRPADGTYLNPSQLYVNCVDSVVAISTTVQTNGFYGASEGSGAGSGFILTEDGYVITNYHVVEGATAISVTTHSGEEYSAKLVGHDATNDLAVLKMDATGLKAVVLGSSTNLAIGDMVVAIGNPLGKLSATQTVGYISGIDREVSTGNLTTISMLQTDAAINPGNSGGPLFNMYGEVIGITTAKYSGTTGSGASIEGIGFAIPIDDVTALIDDLIDYGYVTGAYLAVTVQNTDEASAAMFGLPTGAYIVTVEEGGAAQKAGVQPKDIVIALGEYEVSNVTDLTRALRKFKAGDTTEITVIRSGRELTLSITLDERPQDPTATQETQPPQQEAAPSMPEEYGDLYDYFRRFFG